MVRRFAMRMNPFVNSRHRGVGLPPGCKDLVDVLQNPWACPTARLQVFPEKQKTSASGFLSSGFEIGRLKNLNFHIARLFTVMTAQRALVIFCEKACLVLLRQDGLLSVRLSVPNHEPARELAIRAIFARAHLHPLEDLAAPATRSFKYLLPNAQSDVVSFLTVLLREGYDTSDDAQLAFRLSD
jgi:hypothetical protein